MLILCFQTFFFILESLEIHGLGHGLEQNILADGFDEIILGAHPDRLGSGIDGGFSRHHDHLDLRCRLADLLKQGDS